MHLHFKEYDSNLFPFNICALNGFQKWELVYNQEMKINNFIFIFIMLNLKCLNTITTSLKFFKYT